MTTHIPETNPVPSDDAEEAAAFATMQADATFAGRNMGAGAHIAGILTGAQAATAPTPEALLKDLWPGVDPAAVLAIYLRGVEVGWRGAQCYERPLRFGAQLAEVQERLAVAGFEAMRGLVARSRELAGRGSHPADGEAARER
ncbi:hypothetical protein ACIP2X_37655 [Streptomyces sp. NPDC089424]|uniref:hypothetical protein n=1 Tax=Streptomyces sp. NPDC089424 TaxID=3365917 RepID=UPI0037F54ADC